MPVPKKTVSVCRPAAALKRLKITPEELAEAPPVTSMLKQAHGGLKQVFTAMRLSQNPVLRQFLRKYDAMPVGDRRHLPIEAIALAADVDMDTFLGAAMVALEAQAVSTTKIIAVTSHPKIVAARVKYGLRPSGERDRAALDTAMGFLPSPKGPTFIGKAIFGSGRDAMEQQGGDVMDMSESDPDLDKLFPPANLMQEKLNAIRQRRLPPPSRS